MQSRRREDHMSPSKLRNQHRIEGGHDPYSASRRRESDHSPCVHRRSLSPRNMVERPRRMSLREERGRSSERKDDYGWHLGASRTEKIHSSTRLYDQERKRPHFDERVVRSKYEYADDMDFHDGKSDRLNHVYGYDHHVASARSTENFYSEKGAVSIDGHWMERQKRLVPVENEMMRAPHHAPADLYPSSNYGENEEHVTLPQMRGDADQFGHDKYRESIPADKRRMMALYEEEEKPMFHSRDVSYTRMPVSHPNNFGSSSQFKNSSGTSSGVSRGEFASYRESRPLAASDEYPRGSVKLIGPDDYEIYGQRSFLGARDFEADRKIVTSLENVSCTSTRGGHDEYIYSKSQRILNDDYGYPSNDLQRTMPLHSPLAYDHSQMDNEHRELSRTSFMHHVIDGISHVDESYGSMRSSSAWDHHAKHKQVTSENLDKNRIPNPANHNEGFLSSEHSRFEFGRRELQDEETSHMGVTQDDPISRMRSDYGFGRDSGPRLQERLQEQGHVKRQRMIAEQSIYDPSDKVLTRKFPMEEDINRHDKRAVALSKWVAPKEIEDPYGEAWIEKNTIAFHESRTQRLDRSAYRKVKRAYDGEDHHVDVASEGWLSSQDSLANGQRHSARNHKVVTYVKGHSRSGISSWNNSNLHDRRGSHSHHKIWKRSDNYDVDAYANDNNPSKDWVNPAESEPSEESEEFKQLVDDAFLLYSKKLNLNSAVQRRYKEQGKAGSLFCIVCGRSASKEFMDTQRLVNHAYMSHKVGLRAQHLGLHKAICVMMGWNTFLPCDTVTWVPDVLSGEAALAQKEDLMLWPPLVIIHNISMTNNNPEQQKVIPIDVVEAFLRGKGFVGGKMTPCLGKPADQSVMLVKFLGTFTGLGSAEKLHKYFAENKHGREEFERKTSENSKGGSSSWEAGKQKEKLEEQLLYGYIGIAEDLDRLDYNTKKWIMIKSKKEIKDLANAPVKAEDR